jgi:hypothetical protein
MRGKLDVSVRDVMCCLPGWRVLSLRTSFGGAMIARIGVVVVEEQGA